MNEIAVKVPSVFKLLIKEVGKVCVLVSRGECVCPEVCVRLFVVYVCGCGGPITKAHNKGSMSDQYVPEPLLMPCCA